MCSDVRHEISIILIFGQTDTACVIIDRYIFLLESILCDLERSSFKKKTISLTEKKLDDR